VGRPAEPEANPGLTVLTWLSIQGLALVERIEISFDPSLNVMTGETGAGKSLILGSIALLLGERADPEWLRAGEERGFVEGVFDLAGRPDLIEEVRALEIEPEEGRVIVRRISEEMQKDETLMSALRRVGALPDKTITVVSTAEGVLVGSGGETAEIVPEAAEHIFVRKL